MHQPMSKQWNALATNAKKNKHKCVCELCKYKIYEGKYFVGKIRHA